MDCHKLNNREKQLIEFKDFIENTDEQLNTILISLQWSANSIENVKSSSICPFDSSHRMSEERLGEHVTQCSWKAEGYGNDDVPLPVSSVSPESRFCIKFDEALQNEILESVQTQHSTKADMASQFIPRTSDRLIASFSPEERMALYDYVVAHTVSPDIGEDIADLNKTQMNGDSKKITYLELAAQERNLKRRRAKHRGVHTNKKSHTEIFREVIEQQMEMLSEYMAEKIDDKTQIKQFMNEQSYNTPSLHSDESKWANHTEFEKDLSYHRNVRYDRYQQHSRPYESTSSISGKNQKDSLRYNLSYEPYVKLRHSRKSSPDRDRKHSRNLEEKNYHSSHKSHKRHRSRSRHRDDYKRHRSRESQSRKYSNDKHKRK